LQPIIARNVTRGSTVNTDELHSYKGLTEKGCDHHTVNHGAGECGNGFFANLDHVDDID
jgi:hypothetical protein